MVQILVRMIAGASESIEIARKAKLLVEPAGRVTVRRSGLPEAGVLSTQELGNRSFSRINLQIAALFSQHSPVNGEATITRRCYRYRRIKSVCRSERYSPST